MVNLLVRLVGMDFAERVGFTARSFGETPLRTLNTLRPARAIRQAKFRPSRRYLSGDPPASRRYH